MNSTDILVDKVVNVGLEEIIDSDIEGFNDLVDDLTGAGEPDDIKHSPLSDIDFQVVGTTPEGLIRIRVTGIRSVDTDD